MNVQDPIHRRNNGFTLIELLTVIAIIGILAAILIPVVSSVREQARRSQCMSNMRQIGLAILLYEGDNGRLPGPIFRRIARPVGTSPDTRELNWIFDDYVGARSPVWNCPTNEAIFGTDPATHNLTFLLNNKGSTNPPQFFGYPRSASEDLGPRSLDQIIAAGTGPVGRRATELTQIWMISDVDGQNYSAGNIGVANPGKPMPDDMQPVHDGGRNFVFFDGHAQFRSDESEFPANH